MERVILHCDQNCFFASVELLSHPDLRDVPMAVCGDPASRHGIILAKNEPAKRFGIQTAETVWQVREELGLSISVGVSFNKIFAKLGSDYKKPDATTLISPENWQEIVWPLPVGAMLFVGRSAQRTLAQYGVATIGQLAACRPEMLEKLLGKLGRQLHEYANGLDRSPVRPQAEREPVKSVGNGTTFPHDLTRWEVVRAGLAALSDSVAMRLRRQ